jgi:hypothetical protein
MGIRGNPAMSLYFVILRGFKQKSERYRYKSFIQLEGGRLTQYKTIESESEGEMLALSDKIRNGIDRIRTKGHQFFNLELTSEQAEFLGWNLPNKNRTPSKRSSVSAIKRGLSLGFSSLNPPGSTVGSIPTH